jgi:hypothetical protein
MEQPNMMPNGMPGQMQQSMQRPQQGNMAQQLHAKIISELRSKMAGFQGMWQATYDIRERATRVMQLYVHPHCLPKYSPTNPLIQ